MWVQAVKDPNIVNKLAGDGTIMVGDSPGEFRKLIVSETDRWRTVIKATGLTVDMH